MAQPARKRLLDAAAQLVRERGIARVTTREIAELAGTAEGSLFKNFGDKMGLLVALLSEELPETRAWREAGELDSTEDLETMLARLMARAVDFYAASLPLVAGSVADAELLRRQRDVNRDRGTGPQVAIDATAESFGNWQQAGRMDPDVDPYALALLFCGSAQIQAYTEYLGGPAALRGGSDARTKALVQCFARSILQPSDGARTD